MQTEFSVKVLLISYAIVAKYIIISLMRVSYEKVSISDLNCSPILLATWNLSTICHIGM